jgi:hypothetical protein
MYFCMSVGVFVCVFEGVLRACACVLSAFVCLHVLPMAYHPNTVAPPCVLPYIVLHAHVSKRNNVALRFIPSRHFLSPPLILQRLAHTFSSIPHQSEPDPERNFNCLSSDFLVLDNASLYYTEFSPAHWCCMGVHRRKLPTRSNSMNFSARCAARGVAPEIGHAPCLGHEPLTK